MYVILDFENKKHIQTGHYLDKHLVCFVFVVFVSFFIRLIFVFFFVAAANETLSNIDFFSMCRMQKKQTNTRSEKKWSVEDRYSLSSKFIHSFVAYVN